MTNPSYSRRRFLKVAGSSAVAAGLLSQLSAVRAQVDDAGEQAASLPFAELAGQYGLAPGVSYLNHGSIGTIPLAVHQAHVAYLRLCETNPWLHMWGGAWDAGREEVRAQAAAALGCPTDQVAVTHNVTETFNLLAQGLPLGEGDEVLFSSLNHDGASVCWEHQGRRRGFAVKRFEFPLDDVSQLSADDIVQLYAEQITDKTRVLAFPHIDNTVGVRHPLVKLTRMAKSKGVDYVLVDAAQTFGMLPLNVATSGVDVYAASPHKWMQAPKGLGVSYISRLLFDKLEPMWVTWGQQRWADSVRKYEDYGTRNFPELMALGDALRFQSGLNPERKLARYQALWQHAMQQVDATPGLTWRSPRDWNVSGSLYAVGLEHGKASEVAAALFAQHQIVVRPFAAPELNSLRVSPNVFTRTSEIDRFCKLTAQLGGA